MTEENEKETPAEEVKDKVDEITEEHPSIPEEHHEESRDDDKVMTAIDAMGNRIVEAINSLKEASPVTPAEEEILDETPLRKPWTHRWFGK
jgi:hypothetical protein